LIIALGIFGLSYVPSTSQAQVAGVNFSFFYNELGHYGRWVNNPKYGQVWIYNEPGFRPYYSGGHWDYTQYGWSWVSDYSWGWAPFHYGRWEEDPFYGWIWIPGYEWAPAWVTWSQYDGYYGWAPLGYGVNINVSFGAVPYNRWVFVPRQRICDYNVYNYYVQPRNRYFKNAVVINNYYNYGGNRFVAGPQRVEVERYAQRPIETRSPQWGNNPNVVRRNDNNRLDQNRNWDNRIDQRRDQGRIDNQDRQKNDFENRQRQIAQENRDRNNRYFDRQPNQVQSPQVQSRDWDNRPGSPDRRITRDASPRPNNQVGNFGQPNQPTQRPAFPENNNRRTERMSPRDFPNRNNAIMHNPGNGRPTGDMRGGNGKRK